MFSFTLHPFILFLQSKIRFEKQTKCHFDLEYVEELVKKGNWDELEEYIHGFCQIDDSTSDKDHAINIIWEIKKQNFFEALERLAYSFVLLLTHHPHVHVQVPPYYLHSCSHNLNSYSSLISFVLNSKDKGRAISILEKARNLFEREDRFVALLDLILYKGDGSELRYVLHSILSTFRFFDS
jgi:hypothetical protein